MSFFTSSSEGARFVFRGLAFALFLATAFALVELSGWHLRFLEPRLDELLKAKRVKADVVLFGSSVNRHYNKLVDDDPRSIDEFLAAEMPGTRVIGISQGALDGDNFLAFTRFMERKSVRPRVVIVPVNLRSFSVTWYLRSEYQFGRERGMASGPALWFQFLALMDCEPGRIAPDAYLDHPFRLDGQERTVRANEAQLEGDSLQVGYWNAYLYDLESSHPNMVALKTLGEILVRMGCQPVFYVTPIDLHRAENLVPDLRPVVERNVALIERELSSFGAVLDFSGAVPSEDFDYGERPNEHLNQRGRRWVAGELKPVVSAGLHP